MIRLEESPVPKKIVSEFGGRDGFLNAIQDLQKNYMLIKRVLNGFK